MVPPRKPELSTRNAHCIQDALEDFKPHTQRLFFQAWDEIEELAVLAGASLYRIGWSPEDRIASDGITPGKTSFAMNKIHSDLEQFYSFVMKTNLLYSIVSMGPFEFLERRRERDAAMWLWLLNLLETGQAMDCGRTPTQIVEESLTSDQCHWSGYTDEMDGISLD